jgi:small subunit ribosomal protein S20
MPNTKSAERRMRSSARKHAHNRAIRTRLHSLERNCLTLISAGKREDAAAALRAVTSAFDKAAKRGVMHKSAANRKKSRLSVRLNALK